MNKSKDLFQPFDVVEIYPHDDRNRDDPADGVDDHQRGERVVLGEYENYPEDADAADAYHAGERRRQGLAHSRKRSRKHVQKNVDGQEPHHHVHADRSDFDDLGIGREHAQHGPCENAAESAQYDGGRTPEQKRPADRTAAALHVLCAEVLPHEGHASLRKRTQPVIHHEFIVERDGRCCHCCGTEAVDGRLQAHVAEREYDAAKPRREPHAQDAAQEEGRHAQLPEFQLERPHLVQEHVEQGNPADDVGDDCRNRNARYTHAKARYKYQIQRHVHGARHHEHVEWPLCIALAAQDGGDEVVNHHEGHAGKVDLQVKYRHVQNVFGR